MIEDLNEMSEELHIISYSGGKDSTAMVVRMVE